jgi:hypothetical protein
MRLESEIKGRTVFRPAAVPRGALDASLFVAAILATNLQLAPAYGQAMRTYVSGSGNDSSPCTSAQPCRSLKAALTLTGPGGEIQSLDSADYGYVTINQAVTILGARGVTGVVASNVSGMMVNGSSNNVTLAANLSGITINAGANDMVTLKGLEIDGAGLGANGIQFNSGAALNVQDTVIRGFAIGISFRPNAVSSFSVSGTILSNNTTGLLFQPTIASTGLLTDTHLVNNASGAVVQGASSASLATLMVQNGDAVNNGTVGLLSNGYSVVNVSGTTIANNGTGLQAQGTGAVLQLANSTVTGNGSGWLATNGGQVHSNGSSSIGGNTAGNSAPPSSVTPPPPLTPPPAPPTPPPAVSHLTDGAGNYFVDSNAGYITAL